MPSTLLPFLYQTRTILSRSRPRAPVASLRRSLHTTSALRAGGQEIPFVDEEGAPLEPEPEPNPRSTITPAERQTFETIFADIKARGLKPAYNRANDSTPGTPFDDPTSTTSLSALLAMHKASKEASGLDPNTIQSLPNLRAGAQSPFDQISQASPAGRDAAEDNETAERVRAEAEAHARELERQRLPERERVEKLIISAATDQELWDVLEEEVFSLPKKLGIAEPPQPPGSWGAELLEDKDTWVRAWLDANETKSYKDAVSAFRKATNRQKKNTKQALLKDQDNTESRATTGKGDKLDLYVYGPLYPTYLLLTLRRLHTAFRASSPLALSILPRIKSISLESQVLGVTTPFYNQLMEIYWARYGNLSGVFNLLGEMEDCGLNFDKQTSEVLGRIEADVRKLEQHEAGQSFGKGGSFAAAVVSMPQYEQSVRDLLRSWQDTVESLIVEDGQAGF